MPNEVILLTLLAIAAMVTVLTIGLISLSRRSRRDQLAQMSDEIASLNARMDRMMTALDSVAVEVERIGEAERFAVKALAARSRTSSEGRVVTPH